MLSVAYTKLPAAGKVVPRTARAIHVAVVADAPSGAVLMETMVDDVSWYGGRRESDGCPGVVARVLSQSVFPALYAEPGCIDCSALPAQFDVLVFHAPGALYEFPLIGAVEAFLAVVTKVRALVVCVVQPRVGDDGRRTDYDPVRSASSASTPEYDSWPLGWPASSEIWHVLSAGSVLHPTSSCGHGPREGSGPFPLRQSRGSG